MNESTVTLLKCILAPLKETLTSDQYKSDSERYNQLKWYINGMIMILFPEDRLIDNEEELLGECANHERN